MTCAVFAANVLVAAVVNPHGVPAATLRAHAEGRFELIASELLLGELATVLARDRFRRYLSLDEVDRVVAAIRRDAIVAADPPGPPPVASSDPKDDYLLALAGAAGADVLVSGGAHLLDLRPPRLRIVTPRAFLALPR